MTTSSSESRWRAVYTHEHESPATDEESHALAPRRRCSCTSVAASYSRPRIPWHWAQVHPTWVYPPSWAPVPRTIQLRPTPVHPLVLGFHLHTRHGQGARNRVRPCAGAQPFVRQSSHGCLRSRPVRRRPVRRRPVRRVCRLWSHRCARQACGPRIFCFSRCGWSAVPLCSC